MFAWLEPKCPLDTAPKLWTECRMRWLAGKLGLDRLASAEVILPEHRYFPDAYAGTPADARLIFNRVCAYMKLDPNRFDLDVLPDEQIPHAAGWYFQGERPRIALAFTQLADPERLVATIAHELSHDILLGPGLITLDEADHEPLTDLVPVFLGLGLFMANAPLRDKNYTQNNWHYFRLDRQGYLPSNILGYALALFAYVRGESKPAWARYLRPDARRPLQLGLRYLLKTGDSLFRRDTALEPFRQPTEAEARQRLLLGSPTVRAKTLSDIAELKPPPAALIDPVIGLLHDRDIDVQIAATRALPSFELAARAGVPDLSRCAASDRHALRIEAAISLAAIGAPTAQVVLELTRLLADRVPEVVDAAARGLIRLAPNAGRSVPALVEAIRIREIDCGSSDALADALVAIDPPANVLDRLLHPLDPDIRRMVTRSLRAARFRSERATPAGQDEVPVQNESRTAWRYGALVNKISTLSDQHACRCIARRLT
jgi:hypothetical protein